MHERKEGSTDGWTHEETLVREEGHAENEPMDRQTYEREDGQVE